jgi:hypothetical protein
MIPFIQAASKALGKSPHAAMTSNKYLKHQVESWMVDHTDHLDVQPQKPSLNNLPDTLLSTILTHALPERRAGFTSSIMNTARMFKKTATARPTPNFLLVNKKFSRVGKQVWAQTDFCHIYMNSWTPLPRGLVSSINSFPFVVMTLDIRRGERALGEKLVPSAFGAKIRELVKEMKHLEVLLIRVWHGMGSLGPVSEIIMNNFSSVRVGQAINIASIVSTGEGIDKDRGCPGLLSEAYMQNFISHLLRKSPDRRLVLSPINTLGRPTPEANLQANHSLPR